MGVMICLKVGFKESERRFEKESFSDVLNMQHNKLNRPTNHQSGYGGSQESTSSKSKRPIIADLTIVVMERWRETHQKRINNTVDTRIFLLGALTGRIAYYSGCAANKDNFWDTFYLVDKATESLLILFFMLGNLFTKAYIYFYKKKYNLNQGPASGCFECSPKSSTIGCIFTFLMLLLNMLIIATYFSAIHKVSKWNDASIQQRTPILLMLMSASAFLSMTMFVIKEKHATFPIIAGHFTTLLPCLSRVFQQVEDDLIDEIFAGSSAPAKHAFTRGGQPGDALAGAGRTGQQEVISTKGGSNHDNNCSAKYEIAADSLGQQELHDDISGVYIGHKNTSAVDFQPPRMISTVDFQQSNTLYIISSSNTGGKEIKPSLAATTLGLVLPEDCTVPKIE